MIQSKRITPQALHTSQYVAPLVTNYYLNLALNVCVNLKFQM